MAPSQSAITTPFALLFSTNQRLLTRALEGLPDTDFRKPVTDRNNCMAWVAAHIVQTRAFMLGLLDNPIDTGWGETFVRGAQPPDPAAYPNATDLLAKATDVHARVEARLSTLTDEELAAPSTGPSLPGATTVADQIAFFALHDSYHIGQLGLMRKALGHPQLVG